MLIDAKRPSVRIPGNYIAGVALRAGRPRRAARPPWPSSFRSTPQSAAAADPAGGGDPARRRRDRLSDRLELRARLPPGRRGSGEAHSADPRRRRRASPDARAARPVRDRPLRAARQPAVPDRPAGHARALYVSAAGHARGAAATAASEAQHGRHARARSSGRAGAARRAGRADPVDDADPAR